MFAFQLRQAAEAAPRDKLSDVSQAVWAAFAAGSVTEDEASVLSTFIEARKAPAASPAPVRRLVGSRPRSDASMERRRRWAASGRLPPQIAMKFTLAEQAALAVVTFETSKRGDCRLAVGQIAGLAGIGETSVRNAIKRARALGLVTVMERRVSRFRNDTNVVSIISREWLAWMSLPRSDARPATGFEFVKGANTSSKNGGRRRASQAPQRASKGVKGTPVKARLVC